MPAEGRGFRWKGWRTEQAPGVAERPITPTDEQECQTSSHAQAKGTTRAVAVVRASTGLTTHRRPTPGCEPGATARKTRPLVATGKPVCEPHDSTESPVPEIGTPGSESGGRKRAHGTRIAARYESAG